MMKINLYHSSTTIILIVSYMKKKEIKEGYNYRITKIYFKMYLIKEL